MIWWFETILTEALGVHLTLSKNVYSNPTCRQPGRYPWPSGFIRC